MIKFTNEFDFHWFVSHQNLVAIAMKFAHSANLNPLPNKGLVALPQKLNINAFVCNIQ